MERQESRIRFLEEENEALRVRLNTQKEIQGLYLLHYEN
jgi:hypothetical protein